MKEGPKTSKGQTFQITSGSPDGISSELKNQIRQVYEDPISIILEQFLGGKSLREIASKSGVSAALISKKLKGNNVKIKRRATPNDRNYILKKVESGSSFENLALELLYPLPEVHEIYLRYKNLKDGFKIFTSSKSCKSCKTKKRYTRDGKCVLCVSNNRKKRAEKKEWKESRVTLSGQVNFKLISSKEEKTKIVVQEFEKFNYIVAHDWKYEAAEDLIIFKPTEGLFKGQTCKKSWHSFQKYKGLNLSSLINPIEFISDYCKREGRIVDTQLLEKSLFQSSKTRRLKIKFITLEGIYAEIPMIQTWQRIIEKHQPDFNSIEDKTAAVTKLFNERGRIVDPAWQYKDGTDQVTFTPKIGLFEGAKCIQSFNHVVHRGDSIDWRSVIDQKMVIERLLPEDYHLIGEIPEKVKGSFNLSIRCDNGHLWQPKVTDLLHNESICGKCAARFKNPYGGDSKNRFEEDSRLAESSSNFYIVRVQATNAEHIKLGIANNVQKRGGGRYSNIYYQRESARAICWCIEQILKNRTSDLRTGYKDKHIDGWTEFRSTELDIARLITLASELFSEAEKLGWKEFYSHRKEEIIIPKRGTKTRVRRTL